MTSYATARMLPNAREGFERKKSALPLSRGASIQLCCVQEKVLSNFSKAQVIRHGVLPAL
jgi:hypothetical protein